MKTLTPVFSGILFALALAFAGCASHTQVNRVGDDTYKIVRQAGSGFTRDSAKLEEQARADAEKYCEERGKKLKIVSLTSQRPMYGTGYATAELVFKALDPNDPELAAPAPAPMPVALSANMTAGSESSVAANPPPATPTDELYAELTKLDDLRKRGILTEKEFQAEKKKVLNRSK